MRRTSRTSRKRTTAPKTITLVVQRAAEGGWWGFVPSLRGVYGQGETRASARRELVAALDEALATYRGLHQKPPFENVLIEDVTRAAS